MDKVLCKHSEFVTYITLNNPDKRNAVDNNMSQAILSHLQEAEQRNQRVIVINANTSHGIFSAGHDLSELSSAQDIIHDPMFEMCEAIYKLPIPVIAQINGAVYAGTLHLLIVCDLVYATENSKVIMTANKMGIPFSMTHYQKWLSVMSIHKIKELFFTAAEISAQEAYHSGLFNGVYDTEQALIEKTMLICEQICACCPEGVANTKLQLNTLTNHVIADYNEMTRIEAARHAILESEAFKQRVITLLNKTKHTL